jgi:hypothetical protein
MDITMVAGNENARVDARETLVIVPRCLAIAAHASSGEGSASPVFRASSGARSR